MPWAGGPKHGVNRRFFPGVTMRWRKKGWLDVSAAFDPLLPPKVERKHHLEESKFFN